MPSIKGYGVPRQNPSHDTGDGAVPGLEQEMDVVRHRAPGKATR